MTIIWRLTVNTWYWTDSLVHLSMNQNWLERWVFGMWARMMCVCVCIELHRSIISSDNKNRANCKKPSSRNHLNATKRNNKEIDLQKALGIRDKVCMRSACSSWILSDGNNLCMHKSEEHFMHTAFANRYENNDIHLLIIGCMHCIDIVCVCVFNSTAHHIWMSSFQFVQCFKLSYHSPYLNIYLIHVWRKCVWLLLLFIKVRTRYNHLSLLITMRWLKI